MEGLVEIQDIRDNQEAIQAWDLVDRQEILQEILVGIHDPDLQLQGLQTVVVDLQVGGLTHYLV